jgi:2,4-diketo-3-deoxy-L-fuconate hydrolase
MKLLGFGAIGRERPGLLDSEGRIRDLSSIVADTAAMRCHQPICASAPSDVALRHLGTKMYRWEAEIDRM